MAILNGNAFDNVFFSTNDPVDTISGFAGVDTVSYSLATSGVSVNLSLAGAQATGGSGSDLLVSIENLIGSSFDDILRGDAFANELRGGLGNDVLDGGAGLDMVSYAGAAAGVTVSLAIAGPQNTGSDGQDTLVNIENLSGSSFNDSLGGNAGANRLRGDLGNDVLRGSGGNDILDGGAGSDVADYSALAGAVRLGAFGVLNKGVLGVDSLVGIEKIIGSAGAGDTVDHSGAVAPANGTSTNLRTGAVAVNGAAAPLPLSFTVANFENVIGSNFDDVIVGNAGANSLDGGAGIDTVSYAGATAAVTVSLAIAGAQNTVGDGVDSLANVENLSGSSFNDTLTGNGGNNLLEGGAGGDLLRGGLGADVFRYRSVSESGLALGSGDRLLDFSALQGDRIDLSAIDARPQTLLVNDAFNWRGLLNPTLLAVGDLCYSSNGVNATVFGCTATAGVVNFQVQLDRVTALNVANVVL